MITDANYILISDAHTCMGIEPSTGAWSPWQWPHSWRKLPFLQHSQITTGSSCGCEAPRVPSTSTLEFLTGMILCRQPTPLWVCVQSPVRFRRHYAAEVFCDFQCLKFFLPTQLSDAPWAIWERIVTQGFSCPEKTTPQRVSQIFPALHLRSFLREAPLLSSTSLSDLSASFLNWFTDYPHLGECFVSCSLGNCVCY